MRPPALSLDLFGTIVFFDSERLPRRVVGGEQKVVTIADLDGLLATAAPGTTIESFLEALARSSSEIAGEKASDRREVPTRERFRRALVAVGAQSSVATATAATMAQQHMATLAEAVVCPPDRPRLLAQLARRHPLALVSNFDDGPTAHALLARFDLSSHFRAIVVSADVGFLKPSKEIFAIACARLAAAPADCVHVGDSREADVLGATAAGMTAVWIGAGEAAPAAGSIADLRDLPDWLATRYR